MTADNYTGPVKNLRQASELRCQLLKKAGRAPLALRRYWLDAALMLSPLNWRRVAARPALGEQLVADAGSDKFTRARFV